MVRLHFSVGLVIFLALQIESGWGWGSLWSSTPPPDINVVGIQGVLQWAEANTQAAQQSWQATGYPRMNSPSFWGSEIIYSIMPDRFANGNVSNDFLNLPAQQVEYMNTSSPEGLPSYRHGGDLQGIINRLDYLVDLGVTTIWLTPVLLNSGGEYHGYCPSDLSAIDPNFGTEAEYRELIVAAHKRGLLVVQDIVINHLCSYDSSYSIQPPDHEKCASVLDSQFWSGVPVGDPASQGNLSFSSQFFGPLKLEYFFNRCGPNSPDDTSGEGAAAVYGDFVPTMFDLATYNYDFQNIFTELMKPLIGGFDIDGFRLDAAKHVTEDYLAQFSVEIRAYADTLGKNNFLVMGEVAASADWIGRRLGKMFSDPSNPNDHGNVPASLTTKELALEPTYLQNSQSPFPGLNAVYDFDESGTSRDAFLGLRNTADVASYYASDYYNTIAGQADYRLSWTHLEIHDWPRYLMTQPSNSKGAEVAASYLMTAPGQPIIWMGFEQGFNQNCPKNVNAGSASNDILNLCFSGSDDTLKRQDMFIGGPWRLRSAIPEIDALSYIGVWTPQQTTADWQNDPYLKRDHELYTMLRKLTNIRRSCSPLNQGSLVWRDAQPSILGLVIFSRLFNGAEMVVIINPSSSSQTLAPIPIDPTINYNAAFQVYVNLLDGYQTATVGYQLNDPYLFFPTGFQISPQSFLIMAHSNNTAPFNSYLQTQLCTH